MMGQGNPSRPNLPRTQRTLVQLCTASWVSRPAVTQPRIEPGFVVAPQALRCSALDRCAAREAPNIEYSDNCSSTHSCSQHANCAHSKLVALCDKTAHFRVTLYCPQHKVHLCNSNAV
ncbi:hypothetical protein J4Q44_G00277230 [Coregonus suidteri]|uniref:Uncharacterized protein n=1 Tax=Coregonus suidteri TaxID=861788 RepID=A0AAN8QEL7_9TELE